MWRSCSAGVPTRTRSLRPAPDRQSVLAPQVLSADTPFLCRTPDTGRRIAAWEGIPPPSTLLQRHSLVCAHAPCASSSPPPAHPVLAFGGTPARSSTARVFSVVAGFSSI